MEAKLDRDIKTALKLVVSKNATETTQDPHSLPPLLLPCSVCEERKYRR